MIELLTGDPPYFDLAPMPALFRIVQDDHPPLPDGISAVRPVLLTPCLVIRPLLIGTLLLPLPYMHTCAHLPHTQALRDFLLQCFQKEPQLRISAAKLLKHPWIAKSPKKVEPKPQTFDEIKTGIIEYNEQLASGVFRSSIFERTCSCSMRCAALSSRVGLTRARYLATWLCDSTQIEQVKGSAIFLLQTEQVQGTSSQGPQGLLLVVVVVIIIQVQGSFASTCTCTCFGRRCRDRG